MRWRLMSDVVLYDGWVLGGVRLCMRLRGMAFEGLIPL